MGLGINLRNHHRLSEGFNSEAMSAGGRIVVNYFYYVVAENIACIRILRWPYHHSEIMRLGLKGLHYGVHLP